MIRYDDVLKELDRKSGTKDSETGLIGDIVSTYYNAEVDELIELRAATALIEYLQELDKANEGIKENKEKAEG